jgi:RND family efflux transporter MFP subunit
MISEHSALLQPGVDVPYDPASQPKIWIIRHRHRLFLLLAALAALAALLWINRDLSTSTPGEAVNGVAPALTVTVAPPQVAIWANTLTASGSVSAWQEASIGAQIGGFRLVDVAVDVGDRVRKGQVLARLDQAMLRADERQLVAGFEQAEANRQRALSLKSNGAISDQDVLQFVTAARTASAVLEAKRLQLRYANVTAPDDGVISARFATLGAVVPVGQELFRLIRKNRLEWRGELTAFQIGQVVPGQSIGLSLPDGSMAQAVVRETSPALDQQTRLGLVYADIRQGSRAKAGMYASGATGLGRSAALTVPSESLLIRDGRSYVIKLAGRSATPRVVQQAVTVGRRQGDRVEIVAGLTRSDRIVVGGAGFLGDGDIVAIAPSTGRGLSAQPDANRGGSEIKQ